MNANDAYSAAAISAVKIAQQQTLDAIHLTIDVFGEDREFSTLLTRLKDIGMGLDAALNQMVRIKAHRDIEAEEEKS